MGQGQTPKARSGPLEARRKTLCLQIVQRFLLHDAVPAGPCTCYIDWPQFREGWGLHQMGGRDSNNEAPPHTHTPRGHSSGCSGRGEIKLAVLRDSESEQNDIFNIKYTQGLLGLSIQDEGERETL